MLPVKTLLADFFDLFYPLACVGCAHRLSTGEELLCLDCRLQVPLAHEHLKQDDLVRDLFYGRTPIQAATSLFYYEKIGAVQRMMHALKYRGEESISAFLGAWLGAVLQEDDRFAHLDYIVPVPIHGKRLKQRGYNQVTGFGKELGRVLDVPFYSDVLIKTRHTKHQTQLGQKGRSKETDSPYSLALSLPEGSHVLLVDDVVTTGTTLSLCARELEKIASVRISVATMAVSV